MEVDQSLDVTLFNVDDLRLYEHNSKMHTRAQVDMIAKSIEDFGYCDPIAVWHDENGDPIVVEGEGRVLACRRLGIKRVPGVILDHLSDADRRAYSHVHNQTTLSSGLDLDALAVDIEDLGDAYDWDAFGFEIPDIEPAEESEPVEIAAPSPKRDPVARTGDVYRLGRHRLMCGDSTNPSDVAVLMDGKRADICFGSPPYALERFGEGNIRPMMGHGEVYNSGKELIGEAYADLLSDALDNALVHCDDVMFVLGLTAGDKAGIVDMLASHVDRFCDILVWKKDHGVPSGLPSHRAMVSHLCELIFCFNQTGSRSFSHPQWPIGSQTNLVEAPANSSNEYAEIHHATFNVQLPYAVMERFTESSVLDLFGGTGTTLIAAEQLGRTAYLMEIDPLYVDVTIERWEELTGMKAEKVS